MDVSQGHFLLWKTAKQLFSKKQKPALIPFKVVSSSSGPATTFRSVWKTSSDVLQTSYSTAGFSQKVSTPDDLLDLLVSSESFMVSSSVRERRTS